MKNTGVIVISVTLLYMAELCKDVTCTSVEIPTEDEPIISETIIRSPPVVYQAPEVSIVRTLEVINSSLRNHDRLLDGADNTCINPQTDMIWDQKLYLITVKILTKIKGGILTAHFNDTVNCNDREVFKTYQNITTDRCGFYKRCDLLNDNANDDNNNNTERQECDFQCPCETDGCEVALIDGTDEDVPICEISYN